MKPVSHAVVTTLAGIVVSALFASTANAGCVDLPAPQGKGRVIQAAYQGRVRLASVGAQGDGPQIVGMWKFVFASDGNNVAPFFIPDGAPLDVGYAQWHSDGTEIMNSSRDPATSNFCLGTWAAKGDHTYTLSHFALSWDNTGHLCTPPSGATSCFVGPSAIHEEVVVDPHGNTYTGTVTIDQYDTAKHLLFHLAGKVTAERINPE
jgi:hypothetical protein